MPIHTYPDLPDENERTLRKRLLAEEYTEYMVAEQENDIVEIADALADMIYIICGTALSYGIPLNEIYKAVHVSNMSKIHPDGTVHKRPDGKVEKGDWYKPANISEIINKYK